jgi:3-oxoacyl-[acyl-carrier protein] reductase
VRSRTGDARLGGVASSYDVAIVTGGSCGAGRELAARLASRGYAVVVVYLHHQAEAEATVEAIVGADGAALAVRADVADALDVERLFEETTAAFGHVDVVVHTAVRGAAVVNRQAAQRLRQGGAILTVSGADAIPPPLADELSARGITVNGYAPGIEPPGTVHDVEELVALLDRWRRP